MTKRKLWVIPGEELGTQPVFYKDISDSSSFASGIREFVDLYHLGIDIQNENTHEAACLLTYFNHLVVKTNEEAKKITYYIPKEITYRELEWMSANPPGLEKYPKVESYSLVGGKKPKWKQISGMLDVMLEINEKFIGRKEKGKRKQYVR